MVCGGSSAELAYVGDLGPDRKPYLASRRPYVYDPEASVTFEDGTTG